MELQEAILLGVHMHYVLASDVGGSDSCTSQGDRILYKYRSYGSCYIGGNQVRVNAHVILHANSLFLINVLEEN